MKYLVLIAVLLIAISSTAQEYEDLMITRSGISISCTITLVNDQNIFYTHKPRGTEISEHIALAKVEKYQRANKVITPVRRDVITFADGKTLDVHITKEDNTTISFYSISDSTKSIKKVPKEQILGYQKSATKEMTKTLHTSNTSAGDELITAKNHWYLGLGVTVAGGVVGIIGASDPTSESAQTISIVGGVISLIGTIIIIESWSHIGKAGEKLNSYGLSLGFRGNGISLCYKL